MLRMLCRTRAAAHVRQPFCVPDVNTAMDCAFNHACLVRGFYGTFSGGHGIDNNGKGTSGE